MITLYVNHYTAKDERRRAEYDDCLRRNAACKFIDKIVVLAESSQEHRAKLSHPKIEWVDSTRPTFKRFFDEINNRCDSKELSIVANSDIFFDDSLGLLTDLDLNGVCLALSRWEYDPKSGKSEMKVWDNSQDAWIFQGKVKPLLWVDFPLGYLSCDWRLAWELEHADYRLLNPCFDIKSYHVHPSGVRNHGSNIGGPAAFVTRTRLAPLNIPKGRKSERGVIAYALFGNKDKYTQGAIENLKIAKYLFPNWTCRFYVDETVPQGVIQQLHNLGGELINMPKSSNLSGMFWRFLVADDKGYDRWMVRDCDSRLSYRERRAVDEWIESGLPFHVMKDHIWHQRPIMGCAFAGVKGALPSVQASIDAWGKKGGYGDDEEWLANVVGPLVAGKTLIHDAYATTYRGNTRQFPTPLENYRYVGERIHHDEHCDHGDRKALVNHLHTDKIAVDAQRQQKLEAELVNYLKGKRVAVVGNAKTLLSMSNGAKIDAADIVIRFNTYDSEKFADHAGRRTDIAVGSVTPGCSHLVEKYQSDGIKFFVSSRTPEADRDSYRYLAEAFGEHGHLNALKDRTLFMPREMIGSLSKELGAVPTTGVMFLKWLFAKAQPSSVFVTGFTFGLGEDAHYHADHKIDKHHNLKAEGEWFKRNRKPFVEVDSYLSNL